VTDVIDGSLGTDARATSDGNTGIGSAGRIIDDLLSSDEETGITPDNSRRVCRRRGCHLSFGPPLATHRPERRQAGGMHTRPVPDHGSDATTPRREE